MVWGAQHRTSGAESDADSVSDLVDAHLEARPRQVIEHNVLRLRRRYLRRERRQRPLEAGAAKKGGEPAVPPTARSAGKSNPMREPQWESAAQFLQRNAALTLSRDIVLASR